jgi:hypothetical protein
MAAMLKLVLSICVLALFVNCTCKPDPAPPIVPTASAPASSTPPPPGSAPTSFANDDACANGTCARVTNLTPKATVVYIAFGADSTVLPSSPGWSFCTASANLNCSFPLGPDDTRILPLAGKYLNATFAFGAAPGCGTTKAEVNLNNPSWYDVVDVSLVDGYSVPIAIDYVDASGKKRFGPPNGPSGNETLLGVYPLGCDICVARQKPPCGIQPGTSGCKAGKQFAPSPACQYQGVTKGGGGYATVILMAGIPAAPSKPF